MKSELETKKDQTDKASKKSSSSQKSSDHFSDFDSCEDNFDSIIPKFNLEDFERKNED